MHDLRNEEEGALALHKKQKNDKVIFSLAWSIMFTDNFLFWSFWKWDILSFFEPKSWWKDDIYWLLKVLVLNLLVMGNKIFFSAKELTERWHLLLELLELFELSMIFQDLGNMVFHAVWYLFLRYSLILSFSSFAKFLYRSLDFSFIASLFCK